MMMNPFEEEQYPQSTLLTGPQTHLQPTNSLLTVPPAYTPQYSEEDRINPRRQFWAGMLMDLGNMFGSWNGNQFTRPLTGMGFKQSNLALQFPSICIEKVTSSSSVNEFSISNGCSMLKPGLLPRMTHCRYA